MRLALFDLDHTLIPFDSGLAFMRFLVRSGRVAAGADEDYLDLCRGYVAGRLDLRALHRACMAPLRALSAAERGRWLQAFEADLAPALPPARRSLVDCHRAAGDVCVLVTATNRWIAEACAHGFGIDTVIATEPAMDGERPSGEIDGEPCHGPAKLARVRAWLAGRSAPPGALDAAAFYTDSIADLPLLEAVARPVAVCPDARLRAHASAAGWKVVEAAQSP